MMQNNKILVVDDEPDLCNILKFNLEGNGYAVDVAYSAETALEKELNSYSLILLDVMMHEISGYEMVSILRKERSLDVPVIFISAMSREQDLLNGFNVGADDYIRKPFSLNEVLARVNSVINRYAISKAKIDMIELGLNFDEARKLILVDDLDVGLSRTEFDIFALLYNGTGKVISRQEILQQVWSDQSYISERAVDVNVTRLRKKIGRFGKCITTRSGYGYCFDERKTLEN